MPNKFSSFNLVEMSKIIIEVGLVSKGQYDFTGLDI